jgi:very-short-patch-repair endonuclease
LTDAEQKLWSRLRNRQLRGLKRQMPIGSFVADFACVEARIVIEVDGSQHLALLRRIALARRR